MRSVSFVYLREGSSDDGLVPHLRELLVRSGVDEAVGKVNTARGSVEEKLRAARSSGVQADLYVVHRDADQPSPAARRREVADAAEATGVADSHICVVPVQALEAWLLLDEAEIRRTVGRPSGRVPLDLPRPNRIEDQRDPGRASRPERSGEFLVLVEAAGRGHRRVRPAAALTLQGIRVTSPEVV